MAESRYRGRHCLRVAIECRLALLDLTLPLHLCEHKLRMRDLGRLNAC